nr:hypothetical protein [Tanacetum cinerariifolium]
MKHIDCSRIEFFLKLNWSKENKAKHIRKTIALAESKEHLPLLEKMEALTTRIDSHFKEIIRDMKAMRDGCNKCGGPHPSSDCNDKLWEDLRRKKKIMPPEDIEEIIMVEIMEIGAIVNHTIMMKTETQTQVANDFVKNQFYNLKTKVEQGQKNHQTTIQDLEPKFGRIFDHQASRPTGTLPSNTQTNLKPSTSNDKPYRPPSAQNEHVNAVFTRSGKTYDPPVNPNAKPAIFLDDSEDGADEVKKEAEPLHKKPTHADPLPLKAYKLKFSINVPLVGVLAGMPNYGKFLKDLVSNKKEDDRVPLILGRPFLHTADAIIKVKNKELNLGIREDRATFLIDKAMHHSHLNDDICFHMDVIDEVTEDELDALLDDFKLLTIGSCLVISV